MKDFFFENPNERLKAKKNNLISLITKDILQESQYGFESYHLLYNNNGILNLSVKLQYYGSPWEDTKYLCFDTNADKEIGKALFVNQSKLLQIINKKLRSEESKSFIFKDLSTYKINANNKGKITSISFVFFDLNDRMNSGYPQYLVSFDWDEIQKYISPKYKNILSNK